MKKKSYITTIFLLIATFIVIAIVSQYLYFRLDFTEGGQYSLSKATKDILKKLDTPLTVTAYFTEDLAPDLAKTKNNLKDLLIEYNNLSHGNVLFQFEDPSSDEEIEKNAMQDGIRPVLFNAREKDEIKQQKVFMGIVLRLGEKKEVIPFVDPKSSLEYNLSTAIKKLSIKNKPKIGFVTGHGEPPFTSYSQLMQELNVLYDVSNVDFAKPESKLDDYKVLVMAASADSIPPSDFAKLDDYLDNGGSIFLAVNHVKGDLQNLMGTVNNIGLNQWLLKKGIHINDSFIIDSECNSISVRQRTNFGIMSSAMKFPYFPIITNFADNPATKGLEQVALTFVSPIEFTGDNSFTFTPLAFTSENSGLEKAPVTFDINKKWTRNDFNKGKQTVAGMLEYKSKNGSMSKLIIVGNGDFAFNGNAQQPQKKQADNINLMANLIDYLADDTGLIDLRTKTITSRPIDQLSQGKADFLKWLNFLLPLVLVVIYGLVRAQIKRNQRIKRMTEGYVK